MTDFSALLWVALIILFLLATAGMLAYVAWWYTRNWFAPVTRVEARVELKRTKDWDVSLAAGTPESVLGWFSMMGRDRLGAAKAFLGRAAKSDDSELQLAQGTQYIMIFSFNGRREEFDVPESTFARAREGDTGLLSFKGEKFVCFIPNIKR